MAARGQFNARLVCSGILSILWQMRGQDALEQGREKETVGELSERAMSANTF